MRVKQVIAVLLLPALLFVSGCGRSSAKDPNKVGSQYRKVFQTADPQVKECWDTAMDAMKTNGYASATLALQNLLQQTNVTPEQTQAAHETVVAVSDKMYEAANKGDAAAQQAIQELRKATAR